jgi:outer membrane protein OmpA-like peptidoglycan-associated protein
VKAVFLTAGFAPDHVLALGAGEGRLLVHDTDASGRLIPAAAARNRRVEVQILR